VAYRHEQENLYLYTSGFTAPASGEAYKIDFPNRSAPKTFLFAPTVTNINTNVVVRLDGSLDGTNYAPIISGQTITANGTTFYSVTDRPVKYIQPVFVSESGGTAAVVSFAVSATV
jgi:hypothetical protein